jgi:hypothetical protein
MEVRFAAGSVAKANDYAAELVGLVPDVLVANSSPAVAAIGLMALAKRSIKPQRITNV